jgi:DNA mismatch repair ATPase MutL
MSKNEIRRLKDWEMIRSTSRTTTASVQDCLEALVKNSIEANARTISCSVTFQTSSTGSSSSASSALERSARGTVQLPTISVRDDGDGVRGNLSLCGERFCTNKVGKSGESLASIVAVSEKVKIISRTSDSDRTFQLTLRSGRDREIRGTQPMEYVSSGCICVCEKIYFRSGLMRKKIENEGLKKYALEIAKESRRKMFLLSLIHPKVSIDLSINTNTNGNDNSNNNNINEEIFKSHGSTIANLKDFYGQDDLSIKALFRFVSENVDRTMRVSGYITPITHECNSRKMQFLYINQNYVKKTILHKVIDTAFAEASGKYKRANRAETYCAYVINLQLPHEDVNLTFESDRTILSFTVGFDDNNNNNNNNNMTRKRNRNIGDEDNADDSTTKEQLVLEFLKKELLYAWRCDTVDEKRDDDVNDGYKTPPRVPSSISSPQKPVPPAPVPPVHEDTCACCEVKKLPFQLPAVVIKTTAVPPSSEPPPPPPLVVATVVSPGTKTKNTIKEWVNPAFKISAEEEIAKLQLHTKILDPSILKTCRVVNQFADKFIAIVTEDNEIICVDQHAADERIRFEELQKEYFDDCVPPPGLVCAIPWKAKLDREEYLTLCDNKETINRWGWDFTDGDELLSIALTRVPVCETTPLGVDALKSFLKDLQEFGMKNNPPSCLRTLLASKACRGAIMFGDKLNNQECKILIANLADTQMPFFCAHGRPSAVPLGSIF